MLPERDTVELIDAIRKILELGWPAIVLAQAYLLWRAYEARTAQLIAILEKLLVDELSDDGQSKS
jgi:hypothetical protein